LVPLPLVSTSSTQPPLPLSEIGIDHQLKKVKIPGPSALALSAL